MKKCDVEKIRIADYNYTLPDEKIAKYPLQKRDASKLLLFENNKISTVHFSGIAAQIPEDSLMIFNDTRVIHARLIFEKNTGAFIEVFCLSPFAPKDYSINFQQRATCSWCCMIGNAKRWKDDVLQMQVSIEGEEVLLSAKKTVKTGSNVIVEFSWNNPDFTFSELLEVAGKLPIPPYLNRASEAKDDETYQTVYSAVEGSVAAPTAGLHFTPEVMESLRKKGVKPAHVTLHVGAGTFKPVKSETIGNHDMHTEFISVSRETVQALYENENSLIVVGTTSMRTVESLYYVGKKILQQPDIDPAELVVFQWEPYDEENPILPKLALKSIIDYLDKNSLDQLLALTQIMIVPGYEFHYPQAMITNFHQPQSTLLLLIASFIGENWLQVYEYALQNDYRFLSYGDSSLLWRIL
ncbi:MAG TPA: S-adenosylmethionine:tRNA ribosyltransferase-isomerase [Petrimonas sp.]|uniref:S-adenosylmethionine:tRNA ribosyltransferase-isomerase n=1 Tax=Petrimonas sp. TaxID=2023866 RepID=UPI0009663C14|nr:MAG: S-adenosylmethionine tRNA ribosyltransferase [Bacteroidia bacterium 43-41]HHV85126.1 S-adenosylmethionine:tRNA ribosyltransferase-isomerase [Petrimonas sp.]